MAAARSPLLSLARRISQEPARSVILRRGNATAVDASTYANTPAGLDKSPSRRIWKREEVQEVYDSPLMELIFRAVRLICRILSGQPKK
jgi:hypothetical protein